MFRWLILGILLSAIGTSGTMRARARRSGAVVSRRAEGPLFVTLRVLVTVPVLVGIVAYVVDPDSMSWSALPAPDWSRWLGVALGTATVPAVYWVLRALGSNVSETVLTKPDQDLVTDGPFHWVRHPLYATGLILLIAVALMAANAFFMLFALVAAVLVRHVIIPREEAELERRFGDEYREYVRRTGRLVPRWWA